LTCCIDKRSIQVLYRAALLLRSAALLFFIAKKSDESLALLDIQPSSNYLSLFFVAAWSRLVKLFLNKFYNRGFTFIE
jgi:hypothetical protein